MVAVAEAELYLPSSLQDALRVLADGGGAAVPLAGATWAMRAVLRGEELAARYVALSGLDELRTVEVAADGSLAIGACVTHARLGEAVADQPNLRGLHDAATKAANAAVREAATVGGNLSVAAFPAADLVPALLCLDAEVELARPDGNERVSLERFLQLRSELAPGTVLARVHVPAGRLRTAHARLPLRVAGDYPVAIVSVALDVAADGTVARAAVAVGSVEAVARRWPELEAELVGKPVGAEAAAVAAKALSATFHGREGIEAPGWYRVSVLPTLVRRALTALSGQEGNQ
ncbi:MAG: FAD-binding molybdopterin dehydrogenase [Frankiales bacterium]|jgi:carbon-monoxide dehydrogenase medium subunit|nr:FAD-binding molybdopterin dehydrogenase [Frankiales bacterium]